jgi:Family of unknown function (DUF6885)
MKGGVVRVRGPLAGEIEVVAGPRDFALLHERSMPQKDQLCGPFWGALILSATGHAASQEEVALRAGTTLAEGDPAGWLPPGASPRIDYAATIPVASEVASSGTSATGVARSIEELSEGTLGVVPVAGPWSAERVVSLVEISAAQAPECVLIANLRTGRLWGSRPPARLLLDHLLGRQVAPPPPDWDCGHFLTIAACMRGPGASLIALRDTYPQLGWDGYHLQPAGAVRAALERGDGHEGGVLCACEPRAAEALAGRLGEAGFELRHWDNGSPERDGER